MSALKTDSEDNLHIISTQARRAQTWAERRISQVDNIRSMFGMQHLAICARRSAAHCLVSNYDLLPPIQPLARSVM